eukprot:CAMPEP_0170543848 /NCGR_PEP_ID=MMETSP0211-20121228/2822_1 /TAXON_ID=311385 /ORGANISM="Pseudokeronopsis sp., Strain OXSARD2" /LENGTH=128 /DNA_ID=CAMNT_0010847341 /DNA_START=177 /DNA_END=563 /DNA_ORIENTATION=+
MRKDENPLMEAAKIYFGDSDPKVYGMAMLGEPVLVIRDAEMIEELYINKNKFFDKHPRNQWFFYPLLYDSTVFARSNEMWSKKRKSLSAAFYKEKLGKMMDVVTSESKIYLENLDSEYVTQGKSFNLA